MKEYIWRNKSGVKHTKDTEGKLPTKVVLPCGVSTYYTYYRDTDILNLVRYYKDDVKRHRDGDKPAWVKFYKDGGVKSEEYYKNGGYHRDGDNPSYVWFNGDGSE